MSIPRETVPPMTSRVFFSISATYALLGALGLSLAIPPGYASPVFPAAGVALIAVLHYGAPALPGVWVGSFFLNVGVTWGQGNLSLPTLLAAAAIASGASLQAWVGLRLLQRWPVKDWHSLEHEVDIFRFLVLGGPVVCLVSASVGVASLSVAGVISQSQSAYAWWNWYVGDTLGVLLFAPILLAFLKRRTATWKDRFWVVAITTLITFLAVTAAFIAAARWEDEIAKLDLQHHGKTLAGILQNRFSAHDEVVASVARFVEATPDLGPETFKHFTRSTLEDESDIFALSFNPYVPGERRDAIERQYSRVSPGGRFQITERGDDGQLVRAGDRPDYVAVGYITPLEGNLPAIGFDINSEPKRHAAIERARLSGQAAATEPLHLVQDQQEHVGLLILKPAYRVPDELLGFAVAVIKVDQMVEIAVGGQLTDGLVVRLSDSAAGDRPLYSSYAGGTLPSEGRVWRTRLKMSDRNWDLSVFPTEEYLQQHRPWVAWAIGVAGLIGATLLQVLLLSVTGRAAVIRRQVDEQTLKISAQSEALSRSEERYRSVVDQLKEVVFQTDAQGLWTFLNPAWTEVTGFTVAESLGRQFLDYVHPDDRAHNQALFEPLIHREKDYFRHEVRYLHQAGGYRWIEVFARLILDRNDDMVGTSGTLIDITERKRLEDDLKARMLELQVILDNSSVAITLVKERRQVWVNRRMCELFGYSLEEMVGMPTDRFYVDPKDYRRIASEGYPLLSSGERYVTEIQMHRRDGSTLWTRVYGKAVAPADPAAGSIWILEDISQYRQIQSELTVAKEAAEAASQAKSEFLATMSHEIRTPMNGMLGMVEVLAATPLNATQEEYLELMRQSGQLLLSVINDILDFSRVEAGQLTLESMPFDLEHSALEVVQLFIGSVEKKGIEVVLDYAPDCPRHLLGDPGRIRQILLNLVGNAVKFTERGYVHLRIEGKPRDGRVKLGIHVTDTGIGIDLEQQNRLFQPFTQGDRSTSRKYGGSGLGLAISRELVRLMGGSIALDSKLGVGSTFHIELELPVAEPPPHPPVANLSGLRVLLVDPMAVSARMLTELLRGFGMDVELAADPEAALKALGVAQAGAKPFRFVLVNHLPPQVDGETLAGALRALPVSASPLLVLLASSGQRGDGERFRRAGYCAYLIKPVLQDTLHEVLAAALRPAQAGDLVTRHSVAEARRRHESQHYSGHVLLAEDVRANQVVAASILKRLGLTVDIAADGAEALAKWRDGEFDLVLMDCQMPGVDGYQATERIRAEESGGHIPIIALTANAFAENRQRCLGAGMDDFIAKPFELKRLHEVLGRWLTVSEEGAIAESSTLSQVAQNAADDAIDNEALGRMRDMLGEDFPEFLDAFHTSAGELLATLPKTQAAGELQALERQAHSLKSAARNAGAQRLAALAEQLEHQAHAGDGSDADHLIPALSEEYVRVRKALQDWRGES
jgi:PAS domain S-box-containing protein